MRLHRYGFIFLALYFLLFGAGLYYQIPNVRYFHHIFMSILMLCWLVWRLWKRKGLPSSPLNLTILAFLGLAFLGIPFSLDPRMSLEHLWTVLTAVMMFFFVVNAFHKAQDELVTATMFILAGLMIFLSAIQIFSVLFGWGIGRPEGDGWINYLASGVPLPFERDLRIWLPLGVPTWVAGFVAPLVVISLAWGLSLKQRFGRYFFIGLSSLLGIVLILSFSRGGLIAIALALFVFFGLRLLKNASWLQSVNFPLIAGFAVVVLLIGGIVFFLSQQRARSSGDALRQDLWRSATVMITEHPLTGVGLGNFANAMRDIRDFRYSDERLSSAHNLYLNTAAETGLLSFVILLWAGWQIGRSWWQLRQSETVESARRIRLEGMFAALIGFAAHNLVDTLNFMAALGLLVVMIIYCTVEPAKSRLEERPTKQVWAVVALLFMVIAYAGWFIFSIDPAQGHFEASKEALSVADYELALNEAMQAEALDPNLNLYDIQVAYIWGEIAANSDDSVSLESAISAYEYALSLESTWDEGWLNLAALYERNGDIDSALGALEMSANVTIERLFNPAWVHWARLQEARGYEDEAEIIRHYRTGIPLASRLPLSSFWMETPLRQAALEQILADESVSPEVKYRIAVVQFPERLEEFVPENPQTAAEWWIVGEHTLTVENDAETAVSAFSEAIRLNPSQGDYYVSRARARLDSSPTEAQEDLRLARFLGTRYEIPNAIAIALTDNPEVIESLRIAAVPRELESCDFAPIMYGTRLTCFDILAPMQKIGYGQAIMQPWYDLAASYEAAGEIDDARIVYEAILEVSPEEVQAALALEALENE